MSNLYIYGGKKEISINSNQSDFLYHINTGLINGRGQVIDNLKRINEIILEKRDDYVDYIDSLNSKFIQHKMVYENSISCFFFSDLFNKRTEIFNTYISICHLTFLKERLSDGLDIDRVYVLKCDSAFVESICSFFPDKRIDIQDSVGIKNGILRFHFSQIHFFLKSLLQLLIIKVRYSRRLLIDNCSRVFLSRYPHHFDIDDKLTEDKYVDMVKDGDSFLISMITDGMHQNIGYKQCFKHAYELGLRKEVILLDSFLTPLDIIKSMYLHFRFSHKLKFIIDEEYQFQGITINKFIEKELVLSFLRLPRLLMYRNAIVKVFSRIYIDKFIFYLHEYSYGRFFNYILAKYFPSTQRIGFQHGPASRRKLLYYMSKKSVTTDSDSWLKKTPMPNRVLADDDLSRIVYEESGYVNVKVMDKIPRFYYLNSVKRSVKDSNQILIASGLHDGDAVLNRIIKIVRDNPTKHYLFKPHPRSSIFINGIPNQYKTNNLEFADRHVLDYLSSVSEVIVTYSSVVLEAYKLVIKVNLLYLPNLINESPLIDDYEKMKTDMIVNIW